MSTSFEKKWFDKLDHHTMTSFNCGFNDIYGKIFSEIFTNLDLSGKDLTRLKDLVILRIAHPASKLRSANYLADKYGISNFKVDSIYKLMNKLDLEVINQIKDQIYQKTKSLLAVYDLKINVVFYDLTTLAFETNNADDLRNFGFSKDGKHHHVQMMLAAIVTEEGLPISYEYFSGNCYEGHTLIPVLTKLNKQYNIKNVILVADAALMNQVNLDELDQKGYKYIISARIKNSTQQIKNQILDHHGYNLIIEEKDQKGVITNRLTAKAIDQRLKSNHRLIAYHSTARANHDNYKRSKDIEKITKYLNSGAKNKLTARLRKSYVTVSKDSAILIDEKKLLADKQFDGYFGLATNHKKFSPAELLKYYRGLWQVEQSFRIAKHNLQIRPVYHYKTSRIEAHLVICYIALALIRYVEFILRRSDLYLPLEQIHELLLKMRKVEIVDKEGNKFEIMENMPIEMMEIYHKLGVKWHKRFVKK